MSDIGEKNYLINGVAQEATVQEILGAVDNVAQQEDVQEILSQMGQGVTAELKAPISAQVFSGESASSSSATAVSVTGKGFAIVNTYNYNAGVIAVIVDGVAVLDGALVRNIGYTGIDGNYHMNQFSVRFSKSLEIRVNNGGTSGKILARGIVWFED